MAAVLKEAPPRGRGQTQRLARRSMYRERGSPVRVAVERAEGINAAIIEVLRKTAKYPVEFAFCLTQDSQ
jgi:hypothetical protein